MAIPPPPPGPPPPPPPPLSSAASSSSVRPPQAPPIGGLKLAKPAAGGDDARSALLLSIQKGTKLKKTKTVDKSAPAISGKICDANSTTPSSNSNSPKRSINGSSSTMIGNGAPKLGGLFEGMTAMPKLKPVNNGNKSPAISASSLVNSRSNSPPTANNTSSSSSSGPLTNGINDFNTELTKHLTLKRQKQQQQLQQQHQQQQHRPTVTKTATTHINATEANLKTNRGPPPQPPKNLTTSTSDSVLEKNKTNQKATAAAAHARSNIISQQQSLKSENNDTECFTHTNAIVTTISSNNGSTNPLISKINNGGSVRCKAANLHLTLSKNNVFAKDFCNNYNNNNNNNNYPNTKNSFANLLNTFNYVNNNKTIDNSSSNNNNNNNNNNTNNSNSPNSNANSSNSCQNAAAGGIGSSIGQRNLIANKSTLFSAKSIGGYPSALNSSATTTNSTSNNVNNLSNSSSYGSGSSVVGNIVNGGYNSRGGNSSPSTNSASPSPPTKSPTPPIKPNHGKPNFAPKPPGLQQLAMSNAQRPMVARHHSMRSPSRSPPITISSIAGPNFPTQQHFGTMRTPLTQSHEAINHSLRIAPPPPPPPVIGRPTEAPPKPPNIKPPPPPTPARSISNTNLNTPSSSTSFGTCNNSTVPIVSAVNTILISAVSSNLQESIRTTATTTTSSPSSSAAAITAAAAAVCTSSTTSVAALRDQYRAAVNASVTLPPQPPPPPPPSTLSVGRTQTVSNTSPIHINTNSKTAPPLPPHRTCPAPTPPQRLTSQNVGSGAGGSGGGAPPVPPLRHSSIRAQAPITATVGSNSSTTASNLHNNIASSQSNTSNVSRVVIDLEMKFNKRFHNVTEFPKPPPFVNIPKVYPSRIVKTNTNASINSTNPNINTNISTSTSTSISTTTTSTSSNTGSNSSSICNVYDHPHPFVGRSTNTSSFIRPQLMSGYYPLKKHRAPAPPIPPQAGLAAATVSVIRQTSYLCATAGMSAQPQHQPP